MVNIASLWVPMLLLGLIGLMAGYFVYISTQ
jgi:hypothetical protein